MTNMKIFATLSALSVVLGLAIVSTSNAAVLILDNWQIDLGATGEPGLAGRVTGINEVTFRGLAHQHLGNELPLGLPGLPDTGEALAVDVVVDATSYVGDSGGFLLSGTTADILGIDYEVTGSFSLAAAIGTVLPDGFGGLNASFSHFGHGSAPPIDGVVYDGILDIYVHAANNANTNISSGGSGFEDGTKIATFGVLPGDGGVINTRTLDGSDDAIFELLSAKPGVLFASDGTTDLGTFVAGGGVVLIALTDSNFDLDPDNNNLPDSGPPAAWPGPDAGGFAFSAAGTFKNSYATEDGSLVLGVVPEPASMATWGLLGLIGAGFLGWRKRS